ncbi:MAG: DNRLRE domain-containing protein [Verrucomicrobia bacterium]|nr:DNRLRE domain-containing protein [Verrucomicrobiota bacterium]
MIPIKRPGFCRLPFLIATASVLLADGARSEVLLIPAESDARIIHIAGAPSYQNSNYRDDILSVYTAVGNVQRTFLRFDLSAAVPGNGMRLASARLTLTASTGFGGNPGGASMEVWRVTQPWLESEVTWLRASAATLWTTPGGDIAGGAHGPFAASTANPADGTQISWDVTELVDLWVEGILPNHGLLMLSAPGNGLTFRQSEASQVGDLVTRPHLVVEHAPGVPRLKAELGAGTGDAVLSWRDIGTAVLQERAAIAVPGDWTDSPIPVEAGAGRSVVQVGVSAAPRFFRLRPADGAP